jgi:hypothetical protein
MTDTNSICSFRLTEQRRAVSRVPAFFRAVVAVDRDESVVGGLLPVERGIAAVSLALRFRGADGDGVMLEDGRGASVHLIAATGMNV